MAPAWDTRPSRPRFQGLLCTIAALALLPAIAATLMRVFPPADDQTARLAAFIAYGLLGYLIALGCLLIVLVRARHRLVIALITVAVALLTLCHLAWLGPLFVNDHRAVRHSEVPIDEPEHVQRRRRRPRRSLERAERADIVILVEATPSALQDLKPFGWDERFPYSLGDPKDGFTNTAVYSRFPLRQSNLIGNTSFQQWETTVRVPDVRKHSADGCASVQPLLRWGSLEC